jgi:hypothetical protein
MSGFNMDNFGMGGGGDAGFSGGFDLGDWGGW